ncbi:hypothetical protein AYI70_g8086 [Smittium culicis]|uniref:Uncharacterized protein n=1 Tax=Smittium culicis TaxID=133412 RepID=A0A1R1XHK3_9FUNG|nr:hypothetical protein AYI70_g8086 [Smittium culicis]
MSTPVLGIGLGLCKEKFDRDFLSVGQRVFLWGAKITKCRTPWVTWLRSSSILYMSLGLRNPVTDRSQHSLAVNRLTVRSDVGPHSLNVSNTCAMPSTGLAKDKIEAFSNFFVNTASIGWLDNSAEFSARFSSADL